MLHSLHIFCWYCSNRYYLHNEIIHAPTDRTKNDNKIVFTEEDPSILTSAELTMLMVVLPTCPQGKVLSFLFFFHSIILSFFIRSLFYLVAILEWLSFVSLFRKYAHSKRCGSFLLPCFPLYARTDIFHIHQISFLRHSAFLLSDRSLTLLVLSIYANDAILALEDHQRTSREGQRGW